jgi:hypothetical protein
VSARPTVPDFVGNIRVDQAWGLFQISGAVHDNHAAYFANANDVATTFNFGQNQAGAVNFGHPSDVYGGAVSAALLIKNIPTGAGDDIRMDASWSKGASKYTLGTSGADPASFDIFNGTRFAMGVVTDAIYSGISPNNGNPQTGLQLTNGWGFRGAFNHNWTPNWSSSLFGSIAGLSYNRTAKTPYCNSYVVNAGERRDQRRWYGLPVQPGNFVVRPRLHGLRNRSRHALDPGQEPDLQRRSAVRLSEDQYVGHDHQRAVLGPAAGPHDLYLREQRHRFAQPARSAELLTPIAEVRSKRTFDEKLLGSPIKALITIGVQSAVKDVFVSAWRNRARRYPQPMQEVALSNQSRV